jgi:hypothetical protein
MPTVGQPLRELLERQQMDHRQLAQKNKMASVGSWRNGCATIAIYQKIRSQIVAKSAGSGQPVFKSMIVRLYGP